MTFKEKEIARLEEMKDGLIKKFVDDCEEINYQIIALRNGTPIKKDSEIYYERGYKQGRADEREKVIDEIKDGLMALKNRGYENYRIDYELEFLEQMKGNK